MDPVEPALAITLVYCPAPGVADEERVAVPPGATVREALQAAEMPGRHPEVDLASMPLSIWGRPRGLDDVLRDRDRIEFLRPLLVDPKEARRRRQGGSPRR